MENLERCQELSGILLDAMSELRTGRDDSFAFSRIYRALSVAEGLDFKNIPPYIAQDLSDRYWMLVPSLRQSGRNDLACGLALVMSRLDKVWKPSRVWSPAEKVSAEKPLRLAVSNK